MRQKGERVVILGAAGRDFHNFNVVFRNDPGIEVVAFTAAQIPGIDDRRYPPALSGKLYSDGIPIVLESQLEQLIRSKKVDRVVFAYSDLAHEDVMHLASRALAAGADFSMLGPKSTQLRAQRPVIAVSAVRTGCGKSQVSRWLSRHLRSKGFRVAVLRHPMPYGNLVAQRVQRFAAAIDLDRAKCTAEEREEYEPHIAVGNVVFAGVDYAAILEAAEAEAEIVIWDGGNNDFPFLVPDLHIVLVDALRPRQIATHHPGESVIRMADIAVVNKVDAASAQAVREAISGIKRVNPRAAIVRAASPVRLDDPAAVTGKRVLVVEDGPSITHGGMASGAGLAAARAARAAAIVDPRSAAAPAIRRVYKTWPHIGAVLPAVGYDEAQLAALAATIDAADCDVVVAATPIDLAALVSLSKPVVRARYDFAEAEEPGLGALVDDFVAGLAEPDRASA